MRETAKLFTHDVSFIQIFPFYEENPESDAEAQLDAWIQDIHEEDVVVMLTDILWGSVNPVSYTHLDVYKRQSLYSECRDFLSESVFVGKNEHRYFLGR